MRLHRIARNADGTTEWIECDGIEVKIDQYTFYFVSDVIFPGQKLQCCLIEPQTGMSVGAGKTKRECVESFKQKFKGKTHKDFLEIIKDMTSKYGISSSYVEKNLARQSRLF